MRAVLGVGEHAGTVLRQLDDALDALSTLPLHSYSDGQVLAMWRELEERRRRLAPIDHQLIAQVESRRFAATVGERSTTTHKRSAPRVVRARDDRSILR